MSKAPVALIILDGFAIRDEVFGNAVKAAKKPNFDRYNSKPAVKTWACQMAKWVTPK